VNYQQARCMDVNSAEKYIVARDSFNTTSRYNIPYDALVYGVGCKSNDFGIPGVKQHAFFLKQVRDAMKIRDKIEELFEKAVKPSTTREEKERLLSIVIVGGGPTSIEFAGELHDWLMQDALKMFPQLFDMVEITLIEATNRVLPAFSVQLADYTLSIFRKRKIKVLLNSKVVNVTDDYVELKDGYKVPYGMVVWATGVAPVELTSKLGWQKTKSERVLVDRHLRVLSQQDIFAVGDCAEIADKSLPPTAQVALQQGKYVARTLNELLTHPVDEWDERFHNIGSNFSYAQRGMMAYVGGWRGIVSIGNDPADTHISEFRKKVRNRLRMLTGLKAWLFWRSAYFTMLVSWPNKILVPMYWFKAWIFGRDFSRF